MITSDKTQGDNPLINKILNLKPEFKCEDFISKTDIDFCTNQQKIYDSLLENFDENLKLLEQMKDLSGRNFYGHDGGRRHIQMPKDGNGWAKYLFFSPNYGKKFIYHATDKAQSSFIDTIERYFHKTYHIDFPKEFKNKISVKGNPKTLNYTMVVKALLNSINFQDLKTEGENKIKEEFKDVLVHMRWGEKDQKCYSFHGKRLAVEDGVIYNSYGRYEFWNIEGSLESIIRALSFFENRSLEMLILFTSSIPVHESIDFTKIYEFLGSEHIEGVKFYKNRRIDIIFRTKEGLQKFKDFYKID